MESSVLMYLVALLIILLLCISSSKDERKKRKEQKRQRNRKKTPCSFLDGISEAEFEAIARRRAKRIQRITDIDVHGPIVQCTVESISGSSEWSFTVDFNDWGHITGEYWLDYGNYDSQIPEYYASKMKEAIQLCKERNAYSSPSGTESDDDREEWNGYKENERETPPYKKQGAPQKQAQAKEHNKPKKKKSRGKIIVLTIMVLFAVIFGSSRFLKWKSSRMITVGFSSSSIQGESYEVITKQLKSAGFTEIYVSAVEDLGIDEEERIGTISYISIGGKTDFNRTDQFDCGASIVVRYHEIQTFQVPISSTDAKGENYQDIVSQLEDAGFVNVMAEADYDLIVGLFSKNEAVEMISVDGDTEYDTETSYRPDIEIIVTYHAFKKNAS